MEATGKRGWSAWSRDDLLQLDAPLFSGSVVALGTFDGVHLGHQQILQEAAKLSREKGLPSVAFTFDRHPAATIAPLRKPALLTSFERRLELILETGISHVVVVRFDASFSQVTADEFIKEILCGALDAKAVVVGYDFRFGHGAQGDVASLARAGEEMGFQLNVVQAVECDGERVSSTLVRARLAQGDVQGANMLLGRPYRLEGRVVRGDARGRALGYPTANLDVDPELLVPGDGVYLTRVRVDAPGETSQAKESLAGLTAIGTRPSFGSGERTIETHLINFGGDLYGQRLEIDFCQRLRGIVRFGSPEELVRQMEMDVECARAYFGA